MAGVLTLAGDDRRVEVVVFIVKRSNKASFRSGERLFPGRQRLQHKASVGIGLYGAHDLAAVFSEGGHGCSPYRFTRNCVHHAPGNSIPSRGGL